MQRPRCSAILCLLSAIAVLLSIGILIFSCSRKGKVTIAIMTKLQAGSIVGSSEINASKLFLEQYKIKNIEITPVNDDWKPEKAVEAYREIRKRDIRIIITSHISTCALAIRDAVNRDHVLTFVTGATTDALTGQDDYIIRNVQDVSIEQKSIAEYINTMPVNTILIIKDNDNFSYTDPALKYFRKNNKKAIAGVVEISVSGMNIDTLYSRISGYGFDIVYLLIGGYQSSAGSIAQLAKKVNPDARIMFTPWMKTPTLLETLGSAVKDTIVPSHYPPRGVNRSVDTYIHTYKQRYGYAPTFISLNVYSALQILGEAIADGNTDPDEIKRYIINKKNFTTEFGTVEFDRFGDINAPLYFITDLRKEFL